MKVNELRIGDYINYRGQIIKVTSLYDKGGSNEVGWSDKESVWVNADNVEPISLTPEILEKNEFKEYDGLYRLDIAEGVFVNADFKSKEPFVSIHNTCYRAIPICRYLHQLQNALRLCGITLNIEV